MPRKIYNKLIRDNIPEIIAENGGIAKMRKLDDKEFNAALKAKLLEEATELLEANTPEDILNELSDVSQVIESIAENNNLSLAEVEKQKENKKQKRGSFKKKLFLEYVDED